MPAPIGDAKRHAVEAAITARDGRSRAQIARDTGVSPRTVQRIADQLGLVEPWDTSGTRKATEAAADRRLAARAALADLLVDRATDLIADEWNAPYLVWSFGGKFNEYSEHTLPQPPVEARRNMATIAGIALDKSMSVDRHDKQADDAGAGETLGRLFDGLSAAYRALNRHNPTDDEDDEETTP